MLFFWKPRMGKEQSILLVPQSIVIGSQVHRPVISCIQVTANVLIHTGEQHGDLEKGLAQEKVPFLYPGFLGQVDGGN